MATVSFQIISDGSFQANAAITANDQTLPAVAGRADGSFLAAWASAGSTVQVRLFDAADPTAAAPEITIHTSAGSHNDPCVAALDNGKWLVVWTAKDANGVHTVTGRLLDEDGQPISAEFEIDLGFADTSLPDVVALDGGFAVVAVGPDSGNGLRDTRVRKFDNDGTPLSAPASIGGLMESEGFSPSIARLDGASGEAVAVIFDEITSTGGNNVAVADAALTAGQQGRIQPEVNTFGTEPHAAGLSDGRFIVVTTRNDSSGDEDIGFTIVNDSGTADTGLSAVPIDDGDARAPHVVAIEGDRFVISFIEGGELKLVAIALDGSIDPLLVESLAADVFFAGDAVTASVGSGRFVTFYQSSTTDNAFGSTSMRAVISELQRETLGTNGDDRGVNALIGDGLRDVMFAGAGDDQLLGLGGNDLLSGEDGDDEMFGGEGDDTLSGDAGDDDLFGGEGDDLLIGGDGDDFVSGGDGVDTYVSGGALGTFAIRRNGATYTISRDGFTDTVSTVELFDFDDVVFDVRSDPDSIVSKSPAFVSVVEAGLDEDGNPATLAARENLSAGAAIATVTASDGDLAFGDLLNFTLVDSSGAAFTGPLSITKISATTAQVALSGLLDFETASTLSPSVKITDAVGNSVTQALSVAVLDVDENVQVIAQTPEPPAQEPQKWEVLTITDASKPLVAPAASLFGYTVTGLGTTGTIRFTDSVTKLSDLIITGNEVRLVSAGPNSAPLTLQGDFSDGRFMVVKNAAGGADLFFQENLVDDALVEGRALSEAEVNGAPHPAALTGDGSVRFQVTLSEKATAAHTNALGVYEIDASGNIVDVRLLFTDVKAAGAGSVTVDGVEAGHKLGFFIVQGGVGAGAAKFSDAGGGTADLGDGATLRLQVGGANIGNAVFHAYDKALNVDGLVHARSGADPSGHGVRVAFEDLASGGDRDFQDVVFRVDMVDGNGDFLV